ncbi:hypothetical protein ACWDFL_08350 [Streptomyces bungoensis]
MAPVPVAGLSAPVRLRPLTEYRDQDGAFRAADPDPADPAEQEESA